MAISVPFAASAETLSDVYGGAITTSQCLDLETSGLNAAENWRVSGCVLYIFQLPAMTGRRMKDYRSPSASTPGSFSPARNSRDAPPPVEMWEIWLATPERSTAAAEAPPPTMEVAPAAVAAATARALTNVRGA